VTFFALVCCNGFALAETKDKNYTCWFSGYVSIYGDKTLKTPDDGVMVWPTLPNKVFGLKKTNSIVYLDNEFFKRTQMPINEMTAAVVDKKSTQGDFESYGSNPSLRMENSRLTFVYTNDIKDSAFIGETHVVKAFCYSPQ